MGKARTCTIQAMHSCANLMVSVCPEWFVVPPQVFHLVLTDKNDVLVT